MSENLRETRNPFRQAWREDHPVDGIVGLGGGASVGAVGGILLVSKINKPLIDAEQKIDQVEERIQAHQLVVDSQLLPKSVQKEAKQVVGTLDKKAEALKQDRPEGLSEAEAIGGVAAITLSAAALGMTVAYKIRKRFESR